MQSKLIVMQYIHAMRLFQTQPKWAALDRCEGTEKNQFRKDYLFARSEGLRRKLNLMSIENDTCVSCKNQDNLCKVPFAQKISLAGVDSDQ